MASIINRFNHTGNRDNIFIATKIGFSRAGTNNDPEFLRAGLENSLKNLGIDTIDLLYIAVSQLYQCIYID